MLMTQTACNNVLQALECYGVCHPIPAGLTVANSLGADCQSRIDLYTSIMLPLQGIMVYNTGLNNAYSKVREMSHKT